MTSRNQHLCPEMHAMAKIARQLAIQIAWISPFPSFLPNKPFAKFLPFSPVRAFLDIPRHQSSFSKQRRESWERGCDDDVCILGYPGAVSRVGRKGKAKVFKFGWKSLWVPTLTELFPKLQADAGSWLGTKNALYYCAQSANSFSWVLFVSSYTTAIVFPHLPGSFTKLVRARETSIFYRS